MTEASIDVNAWLERFVTGHRGVAGTVHRRRDDVLELVAAFNIPEPVRRVTAEIPKGKGMAGLAFERNQPVQTCNLKTDTTGDVRPGAQVVNAQAAVALPVQDTDGNVRAVVGIAFSEEREIAEPELTTLSRIARELPAL